MAGSLPQPFDQWLIQIHQTRAATLHDVGT
jgi:hypothetical protein